MDIDFYSIGYVSSTPINGGHWYSDPFNLFTDFGLDHISDSYMTSSSSVLIYPVVTYTYISNPEPVPVPEASSLVLSVIALATIFCFKILTRRCR